MARSRMLFGVGIPLVFIPITAAAYDGVPGMTTPARARYSGYGFPAEIIGHAVWLYFRFPLGLRMVIAYVLCPGACGGSDLN